MNISGITAEHEHRRAVNDCGMMIAWRRRCAGCERSAPGLLFHVEAQQIVQHPLTVVATENVYRILVRHDSVFATSARQNRGLIKVASLTAVSSNLSSERRTKFI